MGSHYDQFSEYGKAINKYTDEVLVRSRELFLALIRDNGRDRIISSQKPIQEFVRFANEHYREIVMSPEFLPIEDEESLNSLTNGGASKIKTSSFRGSLFGGLSTSIFSTCYLSAISRGLLHKYQVTINIGPLLTRAALRDLSLPFSEYLGLEVQRNVGKNEFEVVGYNVESPFLNGKELEGEGTGRCPGIRQINGLIPILKRVYDEELYDSLLANMRKQKKNRVEYYEGEKRIIKGDLKVTNLAENEWILF